MVLCVTILHYFQINNMSQSPQSVDHVSVDVFGSTSGVVTYKGISIQEACRSNKLDAVAALLIEHPELIKQEVDGRMIIHDAAMGRDPAILKMIIEKGGNVNDKSREGETPLLLAASSGATTLIRLLVDEGANIRDVDSMDRGIVHYAIQSPASLHFLRNQSELSEQLTIPDDLMHYCCRNNFFLGTLYCIEQLSMDVNQGDPSALEIASQQQRTTDNKKIINFLIEKGAVSKVIGKQSLTLERSNIKVLGAGSPPVTLFAFLGPNVLLYAASEYFPKLGAIVCVVNLIAVIFITKASIERRKPDPALAGWYFGGLVFGSFVLISKVLTDLVAYDFIHFVWFVLTALMAFFYTKAFLGDPGEVVPTPVGRQKFYEEAVNLKTGEIDGKKYCTTGNAKKPLRSKYCSTTGKLIHRFDHYCVWTCNAIGGGNHVSFFLFTICQLVSQILVALFTFTHYRKQYDNLPKVILHPEVVCLYCDFFFSEKNATTTFFLIAYNTAVLLFITAVVLQQSFFISRNVTSNDVWFPERYPWTFRIGTRVHTLFDDGVFINFKNFLAGRGLTAPPEDLPIMNTHLAWKVSRFAAWSERRRQRMSKFVGNRGLDPTIQIDDAGLLIPGGLVRTITLLPWAQRKAIAVKQAALIESGVLKKDGLALAQFIESEINPDSENKPTPIPPPSQPTVASSVLRTPSASGAVLRSTSTLVRQGGD